MKQAGSVLLALLFTFYCAGAIASQESQCAQGLVKADKELAAAKVQGFGGSIAFAKAAGLLTGAAVQKQFGKYRNCVVKVQRARRLIRKARQGKPS
ncbi:MAG: hypothetical protein OEZ68_01635 [Gammaproteobacteria bacterium]|nr:hypothetical protein [Gammaproteobacteria bacterium]MDH5799481.1 hypothetical protein [Gammaproteobacteria bacterium]